MGPELDTIVLVDDSETAGLMIYLGVLRKYYAALGRRRCQQFRYIGSPRPFKKVLPGVPAEQRASIEPHKARSVRALAHWPHDRGVRLSCYFAVCMYPRHSNFNVQRSTSIPRPFNLSQLYALSIHPNHS